MRVSNYPPDPIAGLPGKMPVTASELGSDVSSELGVVIVNYRTPELTLAAVASLLPARVAFPGLRAVVVDGGSADGSAERIAAGVATEGWGDWIVSLPLAVNGGFAYANNRAIAALATAGLLPPLVALINPDARVRPGALEAMTALFAREPDAGAVGALLVHEDGRPQSSAFRFPSIRSEFCRGARTALLDRLVGERPTVIGSDVALEVPWVTGAAVMFRTAALATTGLFDEGFFLYFEETELMHRLRAGGWAIWHEPAAQVVHDGAAATGAYDPKTGLPGGRRMPAYWYASRRRYFALVHGRTYATLTGIAWLAGRACWHARQFVFSRPDEGAARSEADMTRYGLWPVAPDARSAVATLATPLPDRPAWMASS